MALPDDSWAERVGTFVASKPPARWTAADEIKAMNEIDNLAAKFCRFEATVFEGDNSEPHINAFRLGLTNGDGLEVAKVVASAKRMKPQCRNLPPSRTGPGGGQWPSAGGNFKGAVEHSWRRRPS